MKNKKPIKKPRKKSSKIGHKAADWIAHWVGSWTFVLIQLGLLLFWVTLNSLAWHYRWDPYPFIFLNLGLSMEAAFATPIILIAQNRHDEEDRKLALKDYQTDMESHKLIEKVHSHLAYQDQILEEIKDKLED